MIEISELVKSFGSIRALNGISMEIREQQVFGLVGTNGAGKSTLFRLAAGVLRPDSGKILLDERQIYNNPAAKADLFFLPDEPYFFPNCGAAEMKRYYRSVYPGFDGERFDRLLKDFGMDPKRRISAYSKGMRKQLGVLLGICSGCKYLLCDETFDGLDPVMRQAVKSLFAGDMEQRGLTPVLSSHNLRELEDICDHIGLLHEGGLLLSEDLVDMKLGLQKVQCVYQNEEDGIVVAERLRSAGKLLLDEKRGRIHTLTVRGEQEEVLSQFADVQTVLLEFLPLTLEEIFISETEVVGYDVKKYILR